MASTRRNIGQEILDGLAEPRRGEHGRMTTLPEISEIRERTGLSQSQFSALLGVSVRTLQEWEQGRRAPEQLALRTPETALTYAALDRRANRIARAILAADPAPGSRVALNLAGIELSEGDQATLADQLTAFFAAAGGILAIAGRLAANRRLR